MAERKVKLSKSRRWFLYWDLAKVREFKQRKSGKGKVKRGR